MNHIEIERKFLIKFPNAETLLAQPGADAVKIFQIYLTSEDGYDRRVRILNDGCDHFIYTRKKKLTGFTREELESEVTKEQFDALYQNRDLSRNEIKKIRYRIPGNGYVYEIDVFDFWKKQAVLEIELKSENAPYTIPDYLTVIREVTSDPAYTNHAMALHIPDEG